MVDKKIKRTYTIPLRREFLKVPRHKRAKKAITAIKEFLFKHTKAKEVKLGKQINLAIWERGIKSPPHHIKINVEVVDGVAQAELFGFEFSEKKMEKKAKEPETLKDKLTEKIAGKTDKKAEEDSKKETVNPKDEKKEEKPKSDDKSSKKEKNPVKEEKKTEKTTNKKKKTPSKKSKK